MILYYDGSILSIPIGSIPGAHRMYLIPVKYLTILEHCSTNCKEELQLSIIYTRACILG